MGMSMHVVGFKPPDEKWRKMKEAYEACRKAGIDPPKQVEDFFNGSVPDEKGVEVADKELMGSGAVSKYSADMVNGYEVDVTKLPKDVKVVRFYCSW